ncbi:hypothetical protein CBW65_14635 [Tumebacillus avium]|uniref:Uncharacterized protein n=1 Tax=Tumebacillus avium TaxID=1903704 RepID=A0A1Y0IQH5_9BACL|nr:hypothetical protein [Tumebacillus avium]ARU62096.1 hypothetical protein CBW65_14635 [Tumebacillus avium]
MTTQKFYIPIPNSFYGTEKISSHALYLYAHLYQGRTYLTNTTKTNLSLIESEIKFVKKGQDNRNYILQALECLITRGDIVCTYLDLKKDKQLDISFPKVNGYEKIPVSYSDMTDNHEKYMILCYITKTKRSISFYEFADILSCSLAHVKKVISEMETEGSIQVKHGKYFINAEGLPQREKNSYSVNSRTNKAVSSQTETVNSEDMEDDPEHNWYVRDAKLSVRDFQYYLSTDDEKLIPYAEKRIEAIRQSEAGTKFIDRMLKEAKANNRAFNEYFGDSESQLKKINEFQRITQQVTERVQNQSVESNKVIDLATLWD